MRQTGIWFFLSCKRYLKKWSFIFILLSLPVAAYALRQTEEKEGQEIRIAVYAEGRKGTDMGEDESSRQEHSLEQQLAEMLEKRDKSPGLFRFYLCSSAQQVKEEVAARRAECGYVIPAGLREKLDQKNYRRCIQVYSAPSTVLASLSTEVVYAALIRLYGRDIFLNYLTESDTAGQAAARLNVPAAEDLIKQEMVRAGELYDKWQNNGETFRFEYGYRNQTEDRSEKAPAVFPVRGIVAVYLFLVGLYSAVLLGSDEERGLFLPLSPGKKRLCSLAALAAPVILAAVSGLAALKAGGCLEDPGKEAGTMAVYSGAVCLFAYAGKLILRKPQILCCVIPLFLAGSLVFTPVIVDIRQFLPALGWIEKLFLPSYYLRAF